MYKDKVEFELVDFKVLDEVDSSELATDSSDMIRSLAKVQFILCHSLPYFNSNNASWTYPTLLNSYNTVNGNLVNLNHLMKDNQELLKIKIDNNNIIGYMIDGHIAELEKDEKGLYPLVPTNPVPIIVNAYLFKRAVPILIQKMKSGQKFKVSMECEYNDLGYLYDGEMFTRDQKPEFAGQRELNGKPIVRILGGISPQGGKVNFWGCAILDNQKPADKDADILSTIAMEIGTLEIPEQEELIMEKFLNRVSKETANLIGPLLTIDGAKEINDQDIANALIEQDKKIKELENHIQEALAEKELAAATNLSIADGNPAWSGSAAKKNVAKWASSDGSGDKDKMNWSKYAKAFFWVDAENKESFGGYKLPFADVIDGELKAIPKGVMAAGAVIQGSRGGVSIPADSLDGVKKVVSSYYKKMKRTAPWDNKAEAAAFMGSLEDKVETLKENLKDGLYKSNIFEDEDYLYVTGVLGSSVVVENYINGYGCVYYEIPFTVDVDGAFTFGDKKRVDVKDVIVPYTGPDPDPKPVPDKDENAPLVANASDDQTENNELPNLENTTEVVENQGDIENMPNDKDEALVVVDETMATELATLKTQLDAMTAENTSLKEKISNFENEKEMARKSAVLASRKDALSEDFDVDELLDSSEEDELSSMTDEQFVAYAAKMKKVAAKFKKKTDTNPMPPGKPEMAQTEVATVKKPVMPLAPESTTVQQDLAAKFSRF